MKRLTCLIAVVLLSSVAGFADIARPDKMPSRVKKPDPGIATTLIIRLDRNEKEARLVIPKAQVKKLRAELEQLDREDDNTAAVSAESSFARTQTIASGAFLSLAMVFGGIWFMRSGKTTSAKTITLVAVVVAAGIGSAATFVYANVGPPPDAREVSSKIFDEKVFAVYRQACGAIQVYTKDIGNYHGHDARRFSECSRPPARGRESFKTR